MGNYNDSKNKRLYASWDIHISCNYRCPYCFFDGKWVELAKYNRYLSVTEWVECWDKIYERYGSVHIDISGGEPFTYPSFLELVFELSKRHTLGISTNLSWDTEFFVDKISADRVSIHPSFHPYFAELKSFLRKMIFLKNNKFEVGAVCVGYPPILKNILIYKKEFENEGVGLSVQPFIGIYKGIEYPQGHSLEEKDLITLLSDPVALEYQLERKMVRGELCSAGQKYVRIHADGSVFRCAHSNKIIGNIIDGDFKLLEEPSPCESEFCNCRNEFIHLVDLSGGE